MTSYYDVYCEGCETEYTFNVEGYIGLIENYWCEDCGYEGEFMGDTAEEIADVISKNLELLPIDEIQAHMDFGIEDMPDTMMEVLQLSMHLYQQTDDERTKLRFHRSMDAIVRQHVG